MDFDFNSSELEGSVCLNDATAVHVASNAREVSTSSPLVSEMSNLDLGSSSSSSEESGSSAYSESSESSESGSSAYSEQIASLLKEVCRPVANGHPIGSLMSPKHNVYEVPSFPTTQRRRCRAYAEASERLYLDPFISKIYDHDECECIIEHCDESDESVALHLLVMLNELKHDLPYRDFSHSKMSSIGLKNIPFDKRRITTLKECAELKGEDFTNESLLKSNYVFLTELGKEHWDQPNVLTCDYSALFRDWWRFNCEQRLTILDDDWSEAEHFTLTKCIFAEYFVDCGIVVPNQCLCHCCPGDVIWFYQHLNWMLLNKVSHIFLEDLKEISLPYMVKAANMNKDSLFYFAPAYKYRPFHYSAQFYKFVNAIRYKLLHNSEDDVLTIAKQLPTRNGIEIFDDPKFSYAHQRAEAYVEIVDLQSLRIEGEVPGGGSPDIHNNRLDHYEDFYNDCFMQMSEMAYLFNSAAGRSRVDDPTEDNLYDCKYNYDCLYISKISEEPSWSEFCLKYPDLALLIFPKSYMYEAGVTQGITDMLSSSTSFVTWFSDAAKNLWKKTLQATWAGAQIFASEAETNWVTWSVRIISFSTCMYYSVVGEYRTALLSLLPLLFASQMQDAVTKLTTLFSGFKDSGDYDVSDCVEFDLGEVMGRRYIKKVYFDHLVRDDNPYTDVRTYDGGSTMVWQPLEKKLFIPTELLSFIPSKLSVRSANFIYRRLITAPKVEVADTQSPNLGASVVSMTALVATSVCIFTGKMDGVDWRFIFSAVTGALAISKFSTTIYSTIETVISTICMVMFGYDPISPKRTAIVGKLNVYHEAMDKWLTCPPTVETSGLFLAEYDQYQAYLLEAAEHIPTPIFRKHQTRLNHLWSQRERCVSSKRSSSPDIEPVGVLLSGAGGGGKSFVTDLMARRLYKVIHPQSEPPIHLVWKRCLNEEFDSGYFGHFATVIDDVWRTKDGQRNMKETDFIIRFVNSTRPTLNMADLVDKGNTYFTSEVVFITTNQTQIPDGATVDKASVNRRFNVIGVPDGLHWKVNAPVPFEFIKLFDFGAEQLDALSIVEGNVTTQVFPMDKDPIFAQPRLSFRTNEDGLFAAIYYMYRCKVQTHAAAKRAFESIDDKADKHPRYDVEAFLDKNPIKTVRQESEARSKRGKFEWFLANHESMTLKEYLPKYEEMYELAFKNPEIIDMSELPPVRLEAFSVIPPKIEVDSASVQSNFLDTDFSFVPFTTFDFPADYFKHAMEDSYDLMQNIPWTEDNPILIELRGWKKAKKQGCQNFIFPAYAIYRAMIMGLVIPSFLPQELFAGENHSYGKAILQHAEYCKSVCGSEFKLYLPYGLSFERLQKGKVVINEVFKTFDANDADNLDIRWLGYVNLGNSDKSDPTFVKHFKYVGTVTTDYRWGFHLPFYTLTALVAISVGVAAMKLYSIFTTERTDKQSATYIPVKSDHKDKTPIVRKATPIEVAAKQAGTPRLKAVYESAEGDFESRENLEIHGLDPLDRECMVTVPGFWLFSKVFVTNFHWVDHMKITHLHIDGRDYVPRVYADIENDTVLLDLTTTNVRPRPQIKRTKFTSDPVMQKFQKVIFSFKTPKSFAFVEAVFDGEGYAQYADGSISPQAWRFCRQGDKGDCGNLYYDLDGRIIGMHVAGTSTSRSYAIKLDTDFYDFWYNKIYPAEKQSLPRQDVYNPSQGLVFTEPIPLSPESSLFQVGRVLPEAQSPFSTDSGLKTTPVFNIFGPIQMAPAVVNMEGMQAGIDKFKKRPCTGIIKNKELIKAVFFKHYPPVDSVRELSLEESIRGIGQMKPVALSHSVGHPLKLCQRDSTKRAYVTMDSEQNITYVDKRFPTWYAQSRQTLKDGTFQEYSTVCAKRETRPIREDGTVKPVRGIAYGSFICVLHGRALTAQFQECLTSNPIDNPISVGVNLHGPDCRALIDKLREMGIDEAILSDFDGLDRSIIEKLAAFVDEIIVEWHVLSNATEEHILMLTNYLRETHIEAKLLFFDKVLRLCGQTVSGHCLTTFFNSIAVFVVLMDAIIEQVHESTGVDKYTIAMAIVLSIYGDDNITGCKYKVDPIKLKEYVLENFGMLMTGADKSLPPQVVPLKDVKYLGRSFHDVQNFNCPLDDQTIYGIIYYQQTGIKVNFHDHLRSFVIEASHKTREWYDRHVSILQQDAFIHSTGFVFPNYYLARCDRLSNMPNMTFGPSITRAEKQSVEIYYPTNRKPIYIVALFMLLSLLSGGFYFFNFITAHSAVSIFKKPLLPLTFNNYWFATSITFFISVICYSQCTFNFFSWTINCFYEINKRMNTQHVPEVFQQYFPFLLGFVLEILSFIGIKFFTDSFFLCSLESIAYVLAPNMPSIRDSIADVCFVTRPVKLTPSVQVESAEKQSAKEPPQMNFEEDVCSFKRDEQSNSTTPMVEYVVKNHTPKRKTPYEAHPLKIPAKIPVFVGSFTDALTKWQMVYQFKPNTFLLGPWNVSNAFTNISERFRLISWDSVDLIVEFNVPPSCAGSLIFCFPHGEAIQTVGITSQVCNYESMVTTSAVKTYKLTIPWDGCYPSINRSQPIEQGGCAVLVYNQFSHADTDTTSVSFTIHATYNGVVGYCPSAIVLPDWPVPSYFSPGNWHEEPHALEDKYDLCPADMGISQGAVNMDMVSDVCTLRDVMNVFCFEGQVDNYTFPTPTEPFTSLYFEVSMDRSSTSTKTFPSCRIYGKNGATLHAIDGGFVLNYSQEHPLYFLLPQCTKYHCDMIYKINFTTLLRPSDAGSFVGDIVLRYSAGSGLSTGVRISYPAETVMTFKVLCPFNTPWVPIFDAPSSDWPFQLTFEPAHIIAGNYPTVCSFTLHSKVADGGIFFGTRPFTYIVEDRPESIYTERQGLQSVISEVLSTPSSELVAKISSMAAQLTDNPESATRAVKIAATGYHFASKAIEFVKTWKGFSSPSIYVGTPRVSTFRKFFGCNEPNLQTFVDGALCYTGAATSSTCRAERNNIGKDPCNFGRCMYKSTFRSHNKFTNDTPLFVSILPCDFPDPDSGTVMNADMMNDLFSYTHINAHLLLHFTASTLSVASFRIYVIPSYYGVYSITSLATGKYLSQMPSVDVKVTGDVMIHLELPHQSVTATTSLVNIYHVYVVPTSFSAGDTVHLNMWTKMDPATYFCKYMPNPLVARFASNKRNAQGRVVRKQKPFTSAPVKKKDKG